MRTFLQPVNLPERCYLEEVLMWVAFQRLPVAFYSLDGKDVRESDEMEYEPAVAESQLTEDETRRAGIPPDPNWVALLEGNHLLSVAHYDKYLAESNLDAELREKWTAEREASRIFENKCEAWRPLYEQAIEYPTSRIFIALKEGRLTAKGRLLPALDTDEAVAILADRDQHILDVEISAIQPSFWTLRGIDFEASAARSASAHYCHISFLTDEVLSTFPGDREEVSGVERIGDTFVLSEKTHRMHASLHRGRPPYPWDAFHIEVAELLRRGELPEKKEAAIEHFRSWFEQEHRIEPSRSAVGEKLKPYYDRFVKAGRQKT
jgi:hypothetical protein